MKNPTIEQALAVIAEMQALAAVENDKRKRYNENIQKGDAAFSENNWKLAKQYYSDARFDLHTLGD